jgi:hypothetical protein
MAGPLRYDGKVVLVTGAGQGIYLPFLIYIIIIQYLSF